MLLKLFIGSVAKLQTTKEHLVSEGAGKQTVNAVTPSIRICSLVKYLITESEKKPNNTRLNRFWRTVLALLASLWQPWRRTGAKCCLPFANQSLSVITVNINGNRPGPPNNS